MKRTIAILAVLVLMFALVPMALAAEETAYYYNDKGWDKVGAYTWEPSELWGSWPGGEATDLGNGWWSVVVSDYKAGNHIIFNDCGGGEQTEDLVLADGQNYFYGDRSGDGLAKEAKGLTAEEADAMFGDAPGVPAAPAPTTPGTNPPTGDGAVLLAGLALLFSAGVLIVLNRRRQTDN